MGLGQLLRDIQVTQTDTVTGETINDLIVTGAGAYPDWQGQGAYRGGMGIPGFWRAAVLRAELLGGAPWHAYRDGPGGVAERITPTPLLLSQPAPPDQAMTTFTAMELDLIWHGNAIALRIGMDGEGSPDAMLPVPAQGVYVTRVDQRSGIDLPIGNIAYSIGGRWFDSSEVIHVKGLSTPGSLRGMGVLEHHLSTMDLARELRTQAAASTGAGIPTGVLTSTSPDTTPDQLKLSKEKWIEAQRTRTIAALGPGTDFTALAWNPTDAQLLESRKFTLHEIALIMGLPLSFLGVEGGSRTYSNIEQEGINLIKFTLSGDVIRFEQAITAVMPPGQWARANLDAILRSDTLARYQAHKIALDGKFLTVDEVRAIENRAPLTGLEGAEARARNIAEMVQKIYLGIGRVLTVEDGRELLRMAGADLPRADPILIEQAAAIATKGTDGGMPAARSTGLLLEQLRDEADLFLYWTVGKGRAKWTGKAKPLRALYDQLVKHMTPEKARTAALSWFKDGMGRDIAAGDGDIPTSEDDD